MPNLSHAQCSFEFGELSPRLAMRIDLAAYAKACNKQENMVTLLHGGATKRRGTLYVGPIKLESEKARLLPFVFSVNTKFMLVLNGGFIQFLKNGAFVETSPGVRYSLAVPYSAAQLNDVQYAQSGNTMYLVHPSHAPRLLQRVTDTNWVLTTIPFTYNAVSDVTFSNAFITFKIINGSDVFQVGESFAITTTAGAISTISGPTNGLITHTSVNVATTGSNTALTGLLTIDSRVLVAGNRVLVKDQTVPAENGIYIAASTAWTRATDMDTSAECNSAFVQVANGELNALTYWKQTATVATLGASPLTWVKTTAPGNGQIGGVASMPGSTTSETWTITCTLSSSGRQEWSVVGSVSGSPAAYWKTGSYPQTVSFFEQRLFFGGSPQFPQHIWGSAAGDYLNFTVGNKDNDGVIVQIAGNDYNALTHLVSARNLMPLTTSTEFSFAGPANYAISGISSNVIKDHTRNGSNNMRPLRIGREVVFVQRDGKKLRAISYSVTEDANVAPDITIFSEHLTRTATFTDMAFAPNPDYIAWLIRSDGQLVSLTLAREFDTTAWARHITQGLFENVGAVPGDASDDVYVIVKRTVNGATRRYVELFDYSDPLTASFSDCSAVYSGSPATVISGLSHLEGRTVTAITDKVVHPDMVVTGGQVTLQYPASEVTIGLAFTGTLGLLNPEFGDASQTTQARASSIIDVVVRLQETINAKINGVVIPFRTNTIGFDAPIEPFTGDKRVKNLGWRPDKDIELTFDTPTPATCLGVVMVAQVNG